MAPHPYNPPSLQLPGGWEPMYYSTFAILSVFTLVFLVIGVASWTYSCESFPEWARRH